MMDFGARGGGRRGKRGEEILSPFPFPSILTALGAGTGSWASFMQLRLIYGLRLTFFLSSTTAVI